MRKLGCLFVVLLCAGHFCSGATPKDSPTPATPPSFALEDSGADIGDAGTQEAGAPRAAPLKSFIPDGPSSGQPEIPSFEEILLFDGQDAPDPNDYARLRESAQKGDPTAAYRLAHYHCRYMKDMTEMVKWLRAAALHNHAQAQFALDQCYRGGIGVSEDAAQAVAWCRKAAEQGLADAQLEMVRKHLDGDGVPKDLNEAIKWLKRAAQQGTPDLQYDVAEAFRRGDGIPQDSNEALYWYTKAAERGHAEAQLELGMIYHLGQIRPTDSVEAAAALFGADHTEIPKNPEKAVEWLTKAAEQKQRGVTVFLRLFYPQESAKWFLQAAEQGSVEAQYFVGGMYHEGEGVPRDYAQAVKWLTKAAEQGDNSAQNELALMYYTGDGVRQDYPEAAKWWTKAAAGGDGNAQHRLGLMYRDGQGVRQDVNEAIMWLTKAAEQDNITTQILLALMYSGQCGAMPAKDTVGFEAWHKENLRLKACAESWFKKAASSPRWQYIENELEGFHKDRDLPRPAPYSIQDNAETVYLLAILYHTVYRSPPNYVEAARWFTRAAEQGLPQAQTVLGEIYENGDGVAKDARSATKWYTKAAEQGLAQAQFRLSRMYGKDGIPENDKEELKWLTKAAQQGHVRAQEWLGICYQQGWTGALEDYTEAYKWFILAETGGSNLARLGKESLRKEMTPAQVAEAQRAAKALLSAQQHRSGERQQDRAATARAATGFFVTPAGYLLTARHVVEKVTRIEAIQDGTPYPAKVVLQDEAADVAILKVEGTEFPCLPLVSSAVVKAGDSVFTMGFPQVQVQGSEAKFTEGSISALSGVGGSPRFFQISVPVQPGNSGGPLVNEKGEVVGLIVFRLDDIAALMATGAVPQTVNYALKSSFILPLMESVPGLAEELSKGSAVKDRPGAIENARKAIVLVVAYSRDADSKDSSVP